MSATRTWTPIDWGMVYLDRRCALAAKAAADGVEYSADQATRIVAITLRLDAQRAWNLAEWLTASPSSALLRDPAIDAAMDDPAK